MSSLRLVAEVEANPAFFEHLVYWVQQALIPTLPLGGLSFILYRAGRKGIWPSFPWALAVLCGPVYGMIRWLLEGEGSFKNGFILGSIAAWASGAYIALCLSVVLFAVIGIAPRPHD